MSKLLKFWRYRLEVKLNKMSNEKKIEFLSNQLIKELNPNVDPSCEHISLWIYNKEKLEIETRIGDNFSRIICKYIGK